MTLIKTSDKLPELKKGQKQEIDKEKLLKLAEEVGRILRKERGAGYKYDESISFSKHAFGY